MTLPVEKILPDLKQALADQGAAVLIAPPGSGKTTLVPLALREEAWLDGKKILMLEPRRIAARLAADYMSSLLDEKVGQTVGYQVRFDRRVSKRTQIEVITEGILTRRLQHDPELAGVGLVIFDEFHERSLDSDLAFALCLDVLSALRDDLRLLVMSATMDGEPVSKMLDKAPVINGQGRQFPVRTEYLPPKPQFDTSRSDHLAHNTVQAIRKILPQEQGDILVFLPGVGEINRVQRQLAQWSDCVIRPLHGSLKTAEQQKAIRPDPAGKRRVILATTIAETSVTIEGVSIIVDCGWKRVPRFDANSGLSRLDTVRVSRASADQRAGRAGRLGPGVCFRLWNRGVNAGLQQFDRPEIYQADPAPLVLELANWGVRSPEELNWLDPPPAAAYALARDLLVRLHALDRQGRITRLGKKMTSLPLHPRLARMVCMAGKENQQDAVDLAALLSERDILFGSDSADIEDRLYCLQRFRTLGKRAVLAMGGSVGGCSQIDRVSRQLTVRLNRLSDRNLPLLSVGGLLALAYPDRLCCRRKMGRGYKLVNGRGGKLRPNDPLAGEEWLVVPSLDAAGQDGRIFLAAAIERQEIETLFLDEFKESNEVAWDSSNQTVRSRKTIHLGELLLEEKRVGKPDPNAVMAALITGIEELGLTVLNWTDPAKSLQARVGCMRQWQPEAGWPDLSDEALLANLHQWLTPYLVGISTIRGCGKIQLTPVLLALLDYRQQQQLERDAPTHIRVPSGSRKKVLYQLGEPPILAVRLQEMFGLAQTPAICRGQVQVLLHLLSPAGRPVQITSDLSTFWNSSYFEVRKELKGRYPKHHWPENPWEAEATARVKRSKKR